MVIFKIFLSPLFVGDKRIEREREKGRGYGLTGNYEVLGENAKVGSMIETGIPNICTYV